MNIISGSFNDFDHFKEAINEWAIDYTILSKGDFSTTIRLFTSETLLLSRQKLHAKVEHGGLSPVGYRTIVIPVNYNMDFVWFNKKVSGKEILIFPKNNAIDVVTYPGLDIHLLSIKESVLMDTIESLGLKNCMRVFNNDHEIVPLTIAFSKQFYVMANTFLNTPIVDEQRRDVMCNELIYTMLNYIEESNTNTVSTHHVQQEEALKTAVKIIHESGLVDQSIPQLSTQVGLSSRSLFNAFKEKYHVSPSGYIKSVRLNKVKREIYLSKEMNISEIAGKYNFWHMGQFAKDFKNQFGILPSEVKRKSN